MDSTEDIINSVKNSRPNQEANKLLRKQWEKTTLQKAIKAFPKIGKANKSIAQLMDNTKRIEKPIEAMTFKELRRRQKYLRERHHITNEVYNQMIQDQNGCCAICGIYELQAIGKKLVVDHNHRTGMVRALLCNNCNLALGLFRDDHNILKIAAFYLKEFNKL